MRKSNLAGFSYHLELPKDIRGSFHPKVGMGITEKGLLLMVGSHNLTESAFKSNLELTAIESISIVDQHQELLESVAGFLKNLESHTRTSSPSKDLLQSIQFALMDYGSGGSRRTSAFFLHSYERPIIDQVLDKIEDPVGIKVLVPTHSQNDEWVQGFIETFGGNATFIIDPRRVEISTRVTEYENHDIMLIHNKELGLLHAKLYIIDTPKGEWVMYGSPNFTDSALTKSVKEGGNVEVAILLPPEESNGWRGLIQSLGMVQGKWSNLPRNEPLWTSSQAGKLIWPITYEEFDGWCYLDAPGLDNGKEYILKITKLGITLRVTCENGILKFQLPKERDGSIFIEVFSDDDEFIDISCVNQTPSFDEIDPSIISKGGKQVLAREIWELLTKLHSEKTWTTRNIKGLSNMDQYIDISMFNPHAQYFRSYYPYRRDIRNFTDPYDEAWKQLEASVDLLTNPEIEMNQVLKTTIFFKRTYYFFHGAFLQCNMENFIKKPLVLSVKQYLDNCWSYISDEFKKIIYSSENRWPIDLAVAANYWQYKQIYLKGFDKYTIDFEMVSKRHYEIFRIYNRITSSLGTPRSFIKEDFFNRRNECLKDLGFKTLPPEASLRYLMNDIAREFNIQDDE